MAEIRPLAEKISTVVNILCSKFELSILITSWRMRGSQKSKIASWCCKSVTQWRKFSSVLKLLCISIHTPNYSCLSELLPEVWGGPKIHGVAVVRMHQNHIAGKKFNTVEAPNHIYSRTKFQLSSSITSWDMDRSPLFAIGLTLHVLSKKLVAAATIRTFQEFERIPLHCGWIRTLRGRRLATVSQSDAW